MEILMEKSTINQSINSLGGSTKPLSDSLS